MLVQAGKPSFERYARVKEHLVIQRALIQRMEIRHIFTQGISEAALQIRDLDTSIMFDVVYHETDELRRSYSSLIPRLQDFVRDPRIATVTLTGHHGEAMLVDIQDYEP